MGLLQYLLIQEAFGSIANFDFFFVKNENYKQVLRQLTVNAIMAITEVITCSTIILTSLNN